MSLSRSQRSTTDRRRRMITHGLHGSQADGISPDVSLVPEDAPPQILSDATSRMEQLESSAETASRSPHEIDATVIDAMAVMAAELTEADVPPSTESEPVAKESTMNETLTGMSRCTVVVAPLPRPAGIPVPVSSDRFSPVRETAGLLSVRKLLQAKAPVTWIFTGDNLAHGAEWTSGARSVTEHFAERVRFELRRGLDTVINTGMHGDTARHLLKTLDFRVLRFRPEVVAVSLGMIDAKAGTAGLDRFRRNLREILDRIRNAGAIPLLQTPNLIHFPAVRNRSKLPNYVDVLREEAHRVELPLIDHWAHWQQQIPDEETLLFWLADGRVHPGVYGHRELAKLLFHELGIFDPKSPTCRYAVP